MEKMENMEKKKCEKPRPTRQRVARTGANLRVE